ncbi:hypothetical protein SUGI_0466430 [Cryptomeria japonica]|nr:hypothetical protein SUGI_0466430 [Cryptomeria japonica]
MFLQMQMYCRVVLRFVICVCFLGFTAAKCVPEMCSSMNVSYPFWINNSDCGHPDFQIACTEDEDTGMLSPYFTAFGTFSSGLHTNGILDNVTDMSFDFNSSKIMDIDYEGHLIINSSSINAISCHSKFGSRNYFELRSGGPFTLSNSNRLVVLGNETFGTYSFGNLGEERCVTMNLQSDQPYCRYGCCEINLPDNLPFVNFTGGGVFQLPHGDGSLSCGFSTIMDPSTFTIVDNETYLFSRDGRLPYYGLRLNWGIGLENCSTSKATGDYSCSSKAQCLDSSSGKGHVCKCLPGYEGNGYLNGTDCTDINECDHIIGRSMCVGTEEGGMCHNLAGSYNCSCANGYVGDGFTFGTGCKSTISNRIVFTAIIASLLVWLLKKRHLKLVEAKYYKMLQQHIASTVGRESLRIFSAKELAKACNNYSKEMVLGSGGFGTVFKGILSDGTLVAIKKSKQALNLEDDHEFLNEITILSQINHRNIVKLLGCCIQTKFPLLVSEFVPNGTLFQHLHSKEGSLPWASRLQIAIETGEALAYLHSAASQPIFHRDVKSSNILLNDRFSPKVVDFGISRLISTSYNTHVTTFNIKGTRGYLDPEFFQTSQLTEKSDVYSFGVVLVELLTALKAISLARDSEEMSLSSLFLSRLDHDRLTEILDNRVLEEENLQEMEDMARIARKCLHLERRKRPSMKEVVEELFWVRDGTRKMKFEERSISREASRKPYEFDHYTFSSLDGSTAVVQMSILTQ